MTFNIRDKGNQQYAYLIDFKEKKSPNISNTANDSLLRARLDSSTDNVPQSGDVVNRQYMQRGRNYPQSILDRDAQRFGHRWRGMESCCLERG